MPPTEEPVEPGTRADSPVGGLERLERIPRRWLTPEWVPAEHAISDAMQAVEAMPPDVRLTKAVILLGDARAWVADFVDGVKPEDHYPRPAALRSRDGGDVEPDADNLLGALKREKEWSEREVSNGGEARFHAGYVAAMNVARELTRAALSHHVSTKEEE